MPDLRIVGVAPDAEQHDAIARLHSIPRKGDTLSVWVASNFEAYVEVDMVCWPTWGEEGPPDVYLRRNEEMSDAEWTDVFAAINERRGP